MFNFMDNRKTAGTYPATLASVDDILNHADKYMQSFMVDEALRLEYRLVLEEVLVKLIAKAPGNSFLTVKLVHGVGGRFNLLFECPGDRVVLDCEGPEDFGGKIIHEYLDYVNQAYIAGCNHVDISLAYGHFLQRSSLIKIGIAILVFCLLYLVQTREGVINSAQYIINFYIGCLQTIAAPCVCFALAGAIINLYQNFQHNRQLVNLFRWYLTTSSIAVWLGFSSYFIFTNLNLYKDFSVTITAVLPNSLSDYVRMFTFSNIVEVFQISFPLPLLMLTFLIGLAACASFGHEGDTIRQGIAALDTLFAKMLSIIYTGLPFVTTFVLLTICSESGILEVCCNIAVMLLIFGFLICVLLLIYVLQFKLVGIHVRKFIKEYGFIIKRNFLIGSNIDALPFNRRMLSRKLQHIEFSRLRDSLLLGSKVNMTGNCLIIALFAMVMLYISKIHITLFLLIHIWLIIILLSIGAPNQPGSFLLGIVFILGFLGLGGETYFAMIIMEYLLSKTYSFLNCLDDIIVMVVADRKAQINADRA